MYGATDLIAQNTTTVVLQRMKGETRWNETDSLRQRVNMAARAANADTVLGLLGARYRITETSVRADALSGEVHDFIASGMSEMERTSRVEVKGTRTVQVIETQTLRVKPSSAVLAKVKAGGAFNAGMLYFNIINLHSAWAEVSTRYRHESAMNFASAVFGTTSALGTMVVSGRTVYVAAMARMSAANAIPGASYGVATTKFLAGKLFGRFAGWPGIILGFATDIMKVRILNKAGAHQAATYAAASGIYLLAGGAAILEGSLAWGAGASAVAAGVPVAGWVVAAGLLMIVGGLWLASRAADQNHLPIELWATRTVFGNRMGDGESRTDVPLDSHGRPERYENTKKELQGWYAARFAPVLLTRDQATSLGWPGANSRWNENGLHIDSVEFTALLPGFAMGQSTWNGEMSAAAPASALSQPNNAPANGVVKLADMPEVRTSPHGLLLRFNRASTIRGQALSRIDLRLAYQPNQGLDETASVEVTFSMNDNWID